MSPLASSFDGEHSNPVILKSSIANAEVLSAFAVTSGAKKSPRRISLFMSSVQPTSFPIPTQVSLYEQSSIKSVLPAI